MRIRFRHLVPTVWLCTVLPLCAQTTAPENPVTRLTDKMLALARVGDRTLHFEDIAEMYQLELKRMEGGSISFSQSIHDMMVETLVTQKIQEELLLLGARESKVTVPNEEVLRVFNKFKARFDDEKAYQDYLARQGISAADLLKRIENRVLMQQFQQEVLFKNLQVADAEMDARLLELAAGDAEQAGCLVRQILLYFPREATDKERKDIQLQLEAIRKSCMKGEDFAELAKAHSEGATADQGGLIGWVNTASGIKPEIMEIILGMQIGQLSEVFKSDSGVHLFQVLDRRVKAAESVTAETREAVRQELLSVKQQEALEKYFKEAGEKHDARILTFAAEEK